MSDDNRRNFFRVDLYNENLIVRFYNQEHKGWIRDLSGNGISFYIEVNEEFEECEVEFTIGDETFIHKATCIRRGETKMMRTMYACQFVDIKPKERSKISAKLLRLDAERRK